MGLSASLPVRKGDLHTVKDGACLGHEDGWVLLSPFPRPRPGMFLLGPSWGERNVRERRPWPREAKGLSKVTQQVSAAQEETEVP